MIRRILTAYRIEGAKAGRLRITYIGPALVVVAVFAVGLAQPVRPDGVSDYAYLAYAAPLALNLLGATMAVIYSAGLISFEIGNGAIRMMLVRPLLRRELVLAKFILGVTYALALNVLGAGTGWLFARVAGDLNGVHFGNELLYTSSEMNRAYLTACALSLLPQFAVVGYGIFVSTCTRNAAGAALAAVGIWILADLLKYPLNIAPLVFTTYLESPWTAFDARVNALTDVSGAEPLVGAAVSIVWLGLFLSLAILTLSRRNFSA